MELSICVTSDLHGRLDRFEEIAQHINQIKPDILIDNGDFLQGSLTTYYYDYVKPGPHPMIAAANSLGYDAAVFGNHEFNYPLAEVESMRKQCKFPWIACNIGPFAKPYILKEVKGKKIAVIGVVTQATPRWDEHQYTNNLTFSDAYTTAAFWVQHVKKAENADLIILSYHGGFTKHPETGVPFAEEDGENEGNRLLDIPGVDILITGHQHLEICSIINGIPIIQPGANGSCFSHITYNLVKKNAHTVKLNYVTSSSERYPDEVKEWLTGKIGYTDKDFRYTGLLSSRLKNHPFVDFMHDFQLEATGAQLSVVELLYHEQGGFTQDITVMDILKNFSRPNTLKVLKLTGAAIKEALEQCAAVFAVDAAGTIDFALNVHPDILAPYVYDFWGGLDYKLVISEPVGNRVKNIMYKGRPITSEMTFRVAMNSYRATGADFPMFQNNPVLSETKDIIPELLMRYIKEHSPLPHRQHGHFQVMAMTNAGLSIK
ncbi:bifunctional metallophosphatase/5'-nucleotidase [Lysinibacillus odysseyi]|nr:bifunctional UDP-sugar hydrolase/5'-nucleotidase [Lysinibacillus odysseyi]